jgi:hypothetical protein
MSEQFIRAIAERYGLTVQKRITTGSELKGFATFELSGTDHNIRAAWEPLKAEGRGPAFDALTHVSNPDHPDHGKPYIRLESVWFEKAQ